MTTYSPPTGDIENHVFVSGRRAGQVAAKDAGVLLLRPPDDEHREGAVVRPEHAVTLLRRDNLSSGGDQVRLVVSRRGGPVTWIRHRRLSNPVDLKHAAEVHKVVRRKLNALCIGTKSAIFAEIRYNVRHKPTAAYPHGLHKCKRLKSYFGHQTLYRIIETKQNRQNTYIYRKR